MHMSDALISPAVGGIMWAAAIGAAVYATKKISKNDDKNIIPMMGVASAFVFAAQMINFTIPMTGSSGHLAGGLLLAILLGPFPAFISLISVLTIQAVFFADGGILALGCNIFNMAFIPSFIVYPLIYKPLVERFARYRFFVTVISAIIALQLGAFCVVIQTFVSGISSLPFSKFIILMQPIHLAIGTVEGIVTALTIAFLRKSAPEYFNKDMDKPAEKSSIFKPALILLFGALILGGGISYLASAHPDGLEWSIQNIIGSDELEGDSNAIKTTAADIQGFTSVMPDYSFAGSRVFKSDSIFGLSLAGIAGIVLTLLFAVGTSYLIIRRKRA